MMSPCKGCENRTVTCHGVCAKYQEFKKELEAINEQRREQNRRMYGIHDHSNRRRWRSMRYSRQ